MPNFRNTHPLVLTAAAAATLFSILGSAAVTGLIPATLPDKTVRLPAPYSKVSPADAAAGIATPQAPKDGRSAACEICGIVESISLTRIDGDASGVGVVAGGFAGSVAVIPRKREPSTLTLIGADGVFYGAPASTEPMHSPTVYVVQVRMADGTARTITQTEQPGYDVGEPVKVVSGALTSA